MRRNFFVISAVLAMSVIALPALAQTQGDGQEQGQGQQNFERIKSHILSNMQKRQSCVEAATDVQSLRDCMPKRRDRGQDSRGGDDDDGQ